MGSALCRRPLWAVKFSLKSCDCTSDLQLQGGPVVFCSPWCGCLKGRHYRVFGIGLGSQSLYSGSPGGSFWYLWAHFGDPGLPRKL